MASASAASIAEDAGLNPAAHGCRHGHSPRLRHRLVSGSVRDLRQRASPPNRRHRASVRLRAVGDVELAL
jgi:hypothetical protein